MVDYVDESYVQVGKDACRPINNGKGARRVLRSFIYTAWLQTCIDAYLDVLFQ